VIVTKPIRFAAQMRLFATEIHLAAGYVAGRKTACSCP